MTVSDFEYHTLNGIGSGEYREKGSRFCGHAEPVESEMDIRQALESLQNLHPKARHIAFAWRLGTSGNLFRANDDQEPSGTAGKPILGQIDSAGLTCVLVAVVRYFGGIKLGVPGLIHAYKTAAAEAISGAEIVQILVRDSYDLAIQPEYTGELERILKMAYARVISRSFLSPHATFQFSMPRMDAEKTLDLIRKLDYRAVITLLEDS